MVISVITFTPFFLEDADNNVIDSLGHTPLTLAAENSDGSTVRVLLDAGLAVDAADACGWAALTKAAAHSHLDLLTDLIARGHGLINTITGIGLPYVASALGIFLLRQTFKTIPRELEDAARIEGCNWLEILWKVYVPLAKPTY